MQNLRREMVMENVDLQVGDPNKCPWEESDLELETLHWGSLERALEGWLDLKWNQNAAYGQMGQLFSI